MQMQDNETYEEYRKRKNLPHIYRPYMLDNGTQVEWQLKLENQFPVIDLMPYSTLQVSKAFDHIFVLFENESQITEDSRDAIVRYCGDYGPEHAEKAIPSVADLLTIFKAKIILGNYQNI